MSEAEHRAPDANRAGCALVLALVAVASAAIADAPKGTAIGATIEETPTTRREEAPIEEGPEDSAETTTERTAEDVAGAPRPGDESGRVDGRNDDDSVLRRIGRSVMIVPRVAFEALFAPVRAGVWAYERYHLRERWLRLFFNEARTIGLYPTASVDSEFGVTVGARFVAREIFGRGENFSMRAATQGRWRHRAIARARTGDWFGRVELELGAEYERRPKERFYGIGNADLGAVMSPVDATTDDTAVATRYRQQLSRARLVIDTRAWRALHVRGSGALTELDFGPGESGTPIGDVYMTDRLVGFGGLRYAYGELELLWDSRRASSRWEPASIDTAGWLAGVYAGRATVEDGVDFWRVGGDAQYFLRLGRGPRVLAMRVNVETVDGRLDEVPFDELPKLGGVLLRGYPTDRFRDRTAALATLEYRWDLGPYLQGALFVDAGRVAPAISELWRDFRAGYGVELSLYGANSFTMRLGLASSIDGGFFARLTVDPSFDREPRVVRR